MKTQNAKRIRTQNGAARVNKQLQTATTAQAAIAPHKEVSYASRFVRDQVWRFYFMEVVDAAPEMRALACFIQYHPELHQECQALRELDAGIGEVLQLAIVMDRPIVDPEYIALSEGERWAAGFFQTLQHDSLEHFMRSLRGLGYALINCKDTAALGKTLVAMEAAFGVLSKDVESLAIERAERLKAAA